MVKKYWLSLSLALLMSVGMAGSALADEAHGDTAALPTTTLENCGAYLFEWRPVDCGDGSYFAILAGGNTIQESNVILNRGYDYAYTFDSINYARPWGAVPDLVQVDGVWAIPENWSSLPEGTQPTLQIVLKTNYKTLATDKRYIHVVHLPGDVSKSELPADVRKYLINVDGSDAGAYTDTDTPGWKKTEDGYRYLKPDGTYVSGGWLHLEDKDYFIDENGIMLADTLTPDGHYVNSSGEKTVYMPGWVQDGEHWRYVQKNGYYMANRWLQDTDEKWYYFNMAAYMVTNSVTPDGYSVDENGVWDGNSSSISANMANPGPGADS